MKKKSTFLLLILLIAAWVVYSLFSDYPKKNEFIIYGGPILTMEKEQPTTEAIYVKNGWIEAIGKTEDLLKMTNHKAEVIDLKGKTLLPGFIDIHTHPLVSAFLYQMTDLSGFTHKTPDEVWAALAKAAAETLKGEWIIGKGLDPILTKGLVAPNIQQLDSLVPDNPVLVISQSLHSFWANSLAFKEVGIDKNTPDPSESSFYEKDGDGNLTGFFAEQQAVEPFNKRMGEVFGVESMMNSAVQVLDEYAENGMTTIAALGLSAPDKNSLLLYEHLCGEKSKPLFNMLEWIGKMPKRKPHVRHFVFIRHDAAHLLPDSPQNGDDFYKIIGIKHWYDGSPYTGSMYLESPYMDSDLTRDGFRIPAGHHGEALVGENEMVDFIKKYQGQGWQIAVHTQGDQAIRETVGAFQKTNEEMPVSDFRHRLEHCLLLPPEELEKMAALNMTPSFHINHLYYYGRALKNDIIGAERAEKILPVKSALDKGLRISLHADQPMYESDPLSLLATSVSRQTVEGDTLNYAEAISVMEGLKAITIDAAWQLHLEDKIGSIKKGKYADFVVLDKNPLSVPATELRDIKILETIRAGIIIYKSDKESN